MHLLISVFFSAFLCYFCNGVEGFYTSASPVQSLDPKSFREKVLKGDGIWLVEFYAPWCGHCKSLAPEWKKAAKALKGIVNVAAVDCDKHKSLAGQFGVQGFPTIKVFGLDKQKPTDYQGQRVAKAIIKAGIDEVRKVVNQRINPTKKKSSGGGNKRKKQQSSNNGKAVVTLTDSNFDDLVMNSDDLWMVEFYAPWCGHCKQLAPEWENAASGLLDSGIKFGALDATVHKQKASEFGIQGFPTIKVFHPNSKSSSQAKDYQGGRTASEITSYAMKVFEKVGGAFKIPEIISEKILTDHCGKKKQSICVVAFMPHLMESKKKGREEYIKVLENSLKKIGGGPFRFGWVQGGDQSHWEKNFGLTFGYPSVLAISLAKKRYIIQRGAFTTSSLVRFLNGIISGREKTVPFNQLPKFQPIAKAWDGSDWKDEGAQETASEDDDEIMKEILAAQNKKDEL